ncbi:hypothetical protein [Nocardia sp. NPDC004860]|uniref:hypothetical protein n=1 Tax=Nocardia sp. NPDC004860 TaxID=3154557 RepID=UPI0033B3056D
MNDERIVTIAALTLTALTDEGHDSDFAASDLWPAVRHGIEPSPTVAEINQALKLLQLPDIQGVIETAAGLYRPAPDIDDAMVRLYDEEDDDYGYDPHFRPTFADDRY